MSLYLSRNPAKAVDHYRQMELESRAIGSRPVDLVLQLYERLLQSLDAATVLGMDELWAKADPHIAKARAIIIYLAASLDTERGGAIATMLSELYAAMVAKCDFAVRKRDVNLLQQNRDAVAELMSSWQILAASNQK
jgi:flagellar protein FliS